MGVKENSGHFTDCISWASKKSVFYLQTLRYRLTPKKEEIGLTHVSPKAQGG